jgi:hypothetical protein
MFEDVVKREIESELNTGKGCIVFEVGCALNSHYLEVFCDKMNLRSVGLLDNLVLHLSIDGKKFTDYSLDYRCYPGGLYATIGKRIEHSVSRIGYPYFVEPKDFKKKMELQFDMEFACNENDVIDKTSLIVPIQLNLDADNPVCGLSLRYHFMYTDTVIITSIKHCESEEWKRLTWTTAKDRCDVYDEIYIGELLEGGTNRFKSIITPLPDKLNRLCI